MTFTGEVEADNTIDAAKAFKRMLGLAPASMRSEASMQGLSVTMVRDDTPDDREPTP